jgi:hypothetical protein
VAYEEIKTIQFKRGKKKVLEARLVAGDLGVPMASEPIHEYDTGKLKIGDGVTPYKDLPYFGDSTSSEDSNFVIQDPLSGQVLLYDASLGKWVNKDLADEESIIYLAERGLTIKGYDEATQGQMLVKDSTKGITWVDQPDLSQVQSFVAAAQTAATNASSYAIQAGNEAVKATTAAGQAERINQQTMSWVNDKFWWGTRAEYDAEVEEFGLNPGAFYFVRPE